ncbi:hypothetical protein [Streptomyces sp. NPDC056663]|uniref:hypothetical protein n=1 Tax=Streptomyces sp. NPDC056663 TaxID=3345899 RepID=UPI0036953192
MEQVGDDDPLVLGQESLADGIGSANLVGRRMARRLPARATALLSYLQRFPAFRLLPT